MGSAPTIPDNQLENAAALPRPADALIVYILNVGDGDSIVIEFPQQNGSRAYAVIDCNDKENPNKTLNLLNTLAPGPGTRLRFVCATHPHLDHIRHLEDILQAFPGRVDEFWDSGFRYTSATYNRLIREVVRQAATMQFLRPTSGFETYINGVQLTVLSPSIALRNRYDSYGVDPNNASIVIRADYPTPPTTGDFPSNAAAATPPTAEGRSIILGGDAQTDAWGQVMQEFPHLDEDKSNWARQIRVRQGREPLMCDVLKVSHHASKHGINLELVERMGKPSSIGISTGPGYLISSCAQEDNSDHGFPHMVAQEIMREVRDPQARKQEPHRPDHKLGIHYTAQMIDDGTPVGTPAGSIAVVFTADGEKPALYRLCEAEAANINLALARRAK